MHPEIAHKSSSVSEVLVRLSGLICAQIQMQRAALSAGILTGRTWLIGTLNTVGSLDVAVSSSSMY
jgi:hypothetical protein